MLLSVLCMRGRGSKRCRDQQYKEMPHEKLRFSSRELYDQRSVFSFRGSGIRKSQQAAVIRYPHRSGRSAFLVRTADPLPDSWLSISRVADDTPITPNSAQFVFLLRAVILTPLRAAMETKACPEWGSRSDRSRTGICVGPSKIKIGINSESPTIRPKTRQRVCRPEVNS